MTFPAATPRVWGKAHVTPCHGFYVGITPTCVGKRLKDIRKALHNPQIYSCPHSPSTFINTKEMIFVAQKKLIFIKKLHLTARGIDGVSFVKSKNQKFYHYLCICE